jgi:hypothetical protein
LETLAGIEQSWKPKLMQAVAIFREEWERRLGECADLMIELLIDCLTHQEVAPGDELAARRTALAAELKQRFVQKLSEREVRAHQEIIRLFGHSRVQANEAVGQLFDAELFSDETWRAFGLDERQLIAAGAVGGAAAGASVDVLTAGHTLLAGAAIGGAIGAAGAFFFGKKRPELKVRVPGLAQRFQLGGNALRVGPYAAVNFPWILLDRALGTFAYVINRAHARRDEVTIDSERMKAALDAAGLSTARWADAVRQSCERIFAAIRKGTSTREQRDALHAHLQERLVAVSTAKLPLGIRGE